MSDRKLIIPPGMDAEQQYRFVREHERAAVLEGMCPWCEDQRLMPIDPVLGVQAAGQCPKHGRWRLWPDGRWEHTTNYGLAIGL